MLGAAHGQQGHDVAVAEPINVTHQLSDRVDPFLHLAEHGSLIIVP